MALALVVGTRVVPWLLKRVTRTGSRELFTLCVLAIALGIAYGSAALFGVSFALGAFFAGVILSESELAHQAGNDSLPLKDAFAVLFFVSVGMLFDPTVLVREPLAVLSVLAIIMVGKSLAAFVIVLAFRHPVRTALTVSASLAQIGEFSFILASLGAALGLLPADGRDLILAGALLSIALNPLTFAGIAPLTRWLEARPRLLRMLERRGADRHRNPGQQHRGPAQPRDPRRLRTRRRRHRPGAQGAGTALRRHRARPPDAEHRASRRAFRPSKATPRRPASSSAAGIEHARLLVVATPDSFLARRIVEVARAAESRHRRRRAHALAKANSRRSRRSAPDAWSWASASSRAACSNTRCAASACRANARRRWRAATRK